MATVKQKGSAKDIVEKVGIPVGEIMRDNGYSATTSETPQKLTESKGFKEEMAKYGLTEKLISSSLVEDIKAKPKQRKPELELGAKILRMTDDRVSSEDKPPELHLHIHTEKMIKLKDEYEKKLREVLEDE